MKTFLDRERPIITGMLKSKTKKELLSEIQRLREQGVEAYGFQMEGIAQELKAREPLAEIFHAMSDKPVYVTNYLRCNSTEGIDWHTLGEQLLMAVELGATLVDIPADMFDSSDMELSTKEAAIEEQRQLIARIRSMGGQILMSSHVLRYVPQATVLSIAAQHKARGADISKIVTEANSREEACENFIIQSVLERDLGLKHLFLCNGTHCRRHRHVAPLLGSCMFLTVENALTGQNQPTVAEAIEALRVAEHGI